MTDPELTRTVEAMRQRWWPPGTVGVEVDQHGKETTMAGPSDLDQAIHAATKALEAWTRTHSGTYRDGARIAVEAAAPALLHATPAEQAELVALRHANAQLQDVTREQDQALQTTRKQVAYAEEGRHFAMAQTQEAFRLRDEATDRLATLERQVSTLRIALAAFRTWMVNSGLPLKDGHAVIHHRQSRVDVDAALDVADPQENAQ